MKYLNLGCGSRYHQDWTNVDFVSTGEGVIGYNLNDGIPFPDNTFEMVYHSAVLEHFSRQKAEFFLKECYRVLQPQGIIRVAVPDLEQLARLYLETLEKASQNSEEGQANYEWILIELFDQMIRHNSGGDMANYFVREKIPNEDFVIQRCGVEAKKLMENGYHIWQKSQSIPNINKKSPSLLKEIYIFVRYPQYREELRIKWRELFLQKILKEEYQALEIGRFRQRGEIHQWMYDHYSLSNLLTKCGFEKIIQRTANESYLDNWTSFNLDTEPDGSIYKPDCFYMEGMKV